MATSPRTHDANRCVGDVTALGGGEPPGADEASRAGGKKVSAPTKGREGLGAGHRGGDVRSRMGGNLVSRSRLGSGRVRN